MDTGDRFPEVIATDIEDGTAWVLINDEWRVLWELRYEIAPCEESGWIFCEGHVVPTSDKDASSRVVCEPPESLISLGQSVLEVAE